MGGPVSTSRRRALKGHVRIDGLNLERRRAESVTIRRGLNFRVVVARRISYNALLLCYDAITRMRLVETRRLVSPEEIVMTLTRLARNKWRVEAEIPGRMAVINELNIVNEDQGVLRLKYRSTKPRYRRSLRVQDQLT